jgi:hypothetical protein
MSNGIEKSSLLFCLRLPGRIDSAGAAEILGFNEDSIPLLISAGHLKPLGNPSQNSRKYFATCELVGLAQDRKWLHEATKIVGRYMREKSRRQEVIGHSNGKDEPH